MLLAWPGGRMFCRKSRINAGGDKTQGNRAGVELAWRLYGERRSAAGSRCCGGRRTGAGRQARRAANFLLLREAGKHRQALQKAVTRLSSYAKNICITIRIIAYFGIRACHATSQGRRYRLNAPYASP